MVSQVFLESKNRAYMRAKYILESDDTGKEGAGQYVVNNLDKARIMSKENIRMAPANLVSIIPIQPTGTNYLMNVLDNQVNAGNSGILPMEKRLALQDVFFTSSLGFFLTAYDVKATATYPAIHYQFWTYPAPSLGGLFGLLDLAALAGLWSSGNMEIKVNGIIQTPDWWLGRHQMINQTQTNFAGTPPNPFWEQQSWSEDGYLIMEPNLIVNGGNKNEYTIKYDSTFGQIFGATSSNANQTYQFALALVWDGWLAQNASSIMSNAAKRM
jgi:hypothetical protein